MILHNLSNPYIGIHVLVPLHYWQVRTGTVTCRRCTHWLRKNSHIYPSSSHLVFVESWGWVRCRHRMVGWKQAHPGSWNRWPHGNLVHGYGKDGQRKRSFACLKRMNFSYMFHWYLWLQEVYGFIDVYPLEIWSFLWLQKPISISETFGWGWFTSQEYYTCLLTPKSHQSGRIVSYRFGSMWGGTWDIMPTAD